MTELTKKECIEWDIIVAKRRVKHLKARLHIDVPYLGTPAKSFEHYYERIKFAEERVVKLEERLKHESFSEYLQKVRDYADDNVKKQEQLAKYARENLENLGASLDKYLEFIDEAKEPCDVEEEKTFVDIVKLVSEAKDSDAESKLILHGYDISIDDKDFDIMHPRIKCTIDVDLVLVRKLGVLSYDKNAVMRKAMTFISDNLRFCDTEKEQPDEASVNSMLPCSGCGYSGINNVSKCGVKPFCRIAK